MPDETRENGDTLNVNTTSLLAGIRCFIEHHPHPFVETALVMQAAVSNDAAAHFIAEVAALGLHLPVDDSELAMHALYECAKIGIEVATAGAAE